MEVLKMPKPFPADDALPIDEQDEQRLAQKHLNRHMPKIEELLQKEHSHGVDSTKVFQAVSAMWEDYLQARLKGIKGPKFTLGRGHAPKEKSPRWLLKSRGGRILW